MVSHALRELSSIFNSQPHINNLDEGIVGTKEHISDEFTFMLPHKHFDLLPGEVLYVEKVENGYNVIVKHRNKLDNNSSPCMWLYDSGWIPFGYTRADLGHNKEPTLAKGNYNLGVRWLNNGGTESTDEERRLQWVRLEAVEGYSIVTLVNWNESSDCESDCMPTGCVVPKKGSRLHFPPRHIIYHIPDQPEEGLG